jgi:murein L,D-transpeptidase YcbB/YkuD
MNPLLRSLGPAALFLSVSIAAAAGENTATQAPAASVPPAVQARLMSGSTASGEPLLTLETLRLFYRERGYRPAWGDEGGLSPQIDVLVDALRAADRDGLRPADYHITAIDKQLSLLRPAPRAAGTTPAGNPTDLDLLLSDAFFLYANHLTSGRVKPESVEAEWNISGRARNLVFLLGSALDRGHLAATLLDLAPVRDDYRLLREALAAQRAVAAAGGWPSVPRGATLHPGDRSPRVAALRQRLAATGELPAGAATGELFDAPLADALRHFQIRHGLEPDALAGRRTLAALNATAAQRVRQIEVNLERLRWLPRDLGPRRLLVNVADFRLELAEEGAPTLAMRVIAGRLARRTPFFTGEITSILLNPSWTVPEKIAIEDKLPLILEDPFYLEDNGFKVLAPKGGTWREINPASVDWKRVSKDHFPYQLRQSPGPNNALGRIKFQVPNRHDIYLHDTPSRSLFARTERTFSSGCIRVERALDLAERLLAADPAWTRERIKKTISTGETVSVPLPAPLPVYLLYWTAWVDREGLLQFREDVYGRDEAISEALMRPVEAP